MKVRLPYQVLQNVKSFFSSPYMVFTSRGE